MNCARVYAKPVTGTISTHAITLTPVPAGQKMGWPVGHPRIYAQAGLNRVIPLSLHRHFTHRYIQCCGNTLAIGRISLVAVSDMTNHDMTVNTCHVARGVLEQSLLLFRRHQTEQVSRLSEVVLIIGTVVITAGSTFQRQRRFAEVRLFLPFAVGIRLIVQAAALVAINTHGTITEIGRASCRERRYA